MRTARSIGPRTFLRRQGDRVLSLVRSSPTAGRILLYHEVDDVGSGSAVQRVSPVRFSEHLRWLRELGLRGGSVASVREERAPASLVALSFDDGYASAGRACSELLMAGWSATLYVCPAWVEERRPGLLTWNDLRELSAAGLEIGAHGLAHERLCASDAVRLTALLAEARQRIEQAVGKAVSGLAYPEGLASATARRAAEAAGYRYACSTIPGSNDERTDAYWLRRNEVHDTDDRRLLIGKLAGADDWMAPLRSLENARRCR